MLADHVKLPLSEIRTLEKELRKDISADFHKQDMFKQNTEGTDAIYAIWADSSGNDKLVIEYIYGLNNKPQLSISSVRLSQIKNKLGRQVFKYKTEMMSRY